MTAVLRVCWDIKSIALQEIFPRNKLTDTSKIAAIVPHGYWELSSIRSNARSSSAMHERRVQLL